MSVRGETLAIRLERHSIPEPMRQCKKCLATKPVDDFPVGKAKRPDGGRRIFTRRVCAVCYDAGQAKWNADHRERRLELGRIWRQKNAKRYRAQQREKWRRLVADPRDDARALALMTVPA